LPTVPLWFVRLLTRPQILRWAAPLRTLRYTFGWRPPRIPLHQALSILVIRPDEIGDLVLTTSFLRELRRAAPLAHITLIVKTACPELVQHCPYVDAVYSFDFSAGITRHWSLCRWAWTLRTIRRFWRGFDLIMLPRRGADHYGSELLAYLLAGRGTILAHRESLPKIASGSRLRSGAITYFSNPHVEHEVLHNLRFLRWCGAADVQDDQLELWITDTDRRFARTFLDHNITHRGPLVVVHPSGGRSPLKQWPVVNYKSHVDRLLTETNSNVLVVGGRNELWLAEIFPKQASDRIATSIGQIGLRQVAAVLERASVFVGGDAGPMHIAAATGIAVIGIFGPTSVLRFSPWGAKCRVVSRHYACTPDELETFADRCHACRFAESWCLTGLSVDKVFSEVKSGLWEAGSKIANDPVGVADEPMGVSGQALRFALSWSHRAESNR
jgi:heptosyltransferase-2